MNSTLTDINDVKIGVIRKVLSAFREEKKSKSWGYRLHIKTGVSLSVIYPLLKMLKSVGWIEECGWDGVCNSRKCFALTSAGELTVQVLEQLPDPEMKKLPAVDWSTPPY